MTEPDAEALRELLGREDAKLAGVEVKRWLPAAGRHGTELGARLGARLTKVDHAKRELELVESPEAALRRAADVLREHGSLRELGGNRAAPTVAALIRSGFGDMNPALVVVAVAPAAGGSRVRLDGYALEGLIRQRAATKAVRRGRRAALRVVAEHGRWRVGLVAVAAAGCTLVALSLAARSGGAASGGRLTFSVRVEYGVGGTGAVVSPYALCEANPDGSDAMRLSDRTGDFGEVAWDRDGSRLALVVRDPAAHRSLLQVVEGGGWRPRTLARAAATGLWDPAWSPDGSRIAFASSSGKAPGIYAIGADAREERRLTRGYALYPTWSSEGSRIAYGRIRGRPGSTGRPDRISIVNLDGSGETTFSPDGGAPAWSPDGSRIAFTAPPTQQAADEVYVAVADGSGRTQLTHLWDGQASPASAALGRPSWSPDGTQLAFDRSRAATVGHAEVWTTDAVVLPVAGGQPRALALPDLSALFAWRPAPPLRDADAAARPCTLHAPKRGGTLRSGSLDDLILGSERRDVIHGGPGNDWIEGGSGDDVLDGGPGRDDLWPGPGTDRVLARDGKRDTIHCGDLRQDTVIADPIDQAQGHCKRVER